MNCTLHASLVRLFIEQDQISQFSLLEKLWALAVLLFEALQLVIVAIP